MSWIWPFQKQTEEEKKIDSKLSPHDFEDEIQNEISKPLIDESQIEKGVRKLFQLYTEKDDKKFNLGDPLNLWSPNNLYSEPTLVWFIGSRKQQEKEEFFVVHTRDQEKVIIEIVNGFRLQPKKKEEEILMPMCIKKFIEEIPLQLDSGDEVEIIPEYASLFDCYGIKHLSPVIVIKSFSIQK
jgi:hypothetical protein